MGVKDIVQKIKLPQGIGKIASTLVLGTALGIGATLLYQAKKHAAHDEHAAKPGEHGEEHGDGHGSHEDAPKKPTLFGKFLHTYGSALISVQDKVDALHKSEQENKKLRLENSYLRLQAESAKFDCTSRASAQRTQEIELKLSGETGFHAGRSLASIAYRPPSHLMPPHLYNLGVSYFTSGQPEDTEKAAVIFTLLTNLEEEDTYKTQKNYLMTGIAWYRLDNYALANEYFEKVIRAPASGGDHVSEQAQARLWKGIVAERSFKHGKSQELLRDLLDHHPHSTEAKWINKPGGEHE